MDLDQNHLVVISENTESAKNNIWYIQVKHKNSRAPQQGVRESLMV